MYLKTLSLINYKSFDTTNFDFDEKINCFVGNNGVGKTNLLDAIYQLAFGRSYFSNQAQYDIRHDEDFYVIDGTFCKEEREEHIICSFKRNHRKIINRNGKTYQKLSEHLGLIAAVIISPTDRDLINEGGSIRRKYIDHIICQSDKNYLQHLIAYNKAIEQRNALLKYFVANGNFSADSLSIYDDILIRNGQAIFSNREQFIESFKPILQRYYMAIAHAEETVNIIYKSSLQDENFKDILRQSLLRDRQTQYTTMGVHKDDFIFTIGGYPIRRFGSQGQQKSFLIALKLAQFDFIRQYCHQTPILLLDDIFDKIDAERVGKLMKLVNTEDFGQIFISDTHPERTENIIKNIHQSYKMIHLL